MLSENKVWDFDFDLMSGVLDTLDNQLASLDATEKTCPDPDGFGILDEMEYLSGIGFVVCQRYLSATASWSRIPKRQALDLPPLLSSGKSVATVVNAAANYWKHGKDTPPSCENTLWSSTMQIIQEAGVEPTGYACSNLLFLIVGEKKPPFAAMSARLEEWRSSVIDLRHKRVR